MDGEDERDAYRRTLGARIAIVAGRYATKAAAADAAGVTVEQLNKWIKGTVKAPAEALKALAEDCDVDFSWLVVGDTAAPNAGSGPVAAMDISIIGHEVAEIVVRTYRSKKVRLPDNVLAQEVVRRIAQLYAKADNAKDLKELNLLLPWLEDQILKSLLQTGGDGADKESA